MLESEVARLLTIAAAVDNRRLEGLAGQAALAAWGDVLSGFEYDECRDAMREHRLTAPGVYLEPGHIAQLVLAARAARRVDGVEEERAEVARFSAFTGIPVASVVARWNDVEWRAARLAEARHEHKRKALEA